MYRKMKLAPSTTCNCGLEDQMVEHALQRCLLLQTARQNENAWHAAVHVYTKLYGSKEELAKMAIFILQCGNDKEVVIILQCGNDKEVVICVTFY